MDPDCQQQNDRIDGQQKLILMMLARHLPDEVADFSGLPLEDVMRIAYGMPVKIDFP